MSESPENSMGEPPAGSMNETSPRPARALARWIEIASWSFAALGLALPLVFFTPAFAAFRDAMLAWAYGRPLLPAADHDLLHLMLGILGGSIAGKWIVHALLARGPLADGRAWARNLSLVGLAAWFVLDSAVSLAIGASFNIWMINLVPLVLVGIPLCLLVPEKRGQTPFSQRTHPAPPTGKGKRGLTPFFVKQNASPWKWGLTPFSVRACFWASVFGASTGLGIALGAGTPLFAPWFAALESSQYGGAALPESSRQLASFFFGPIGGCTLAQFLMLAGFVRCDGGTRRAATAGAASILAWFTIDSVYGLAHDGLFNIAMINVPAVIMTLPPWIMLAAGLRSRND